MVSKDAVEKAMKRAGVNLLQLTACDAITREGSKYQIETGLKRKGCAIRPVDHMMTFRGRITIHIRDPINSCGARKLGQRCWFFIYLFK